MSIRELYLPFSTAAQSRRRFFALSVALFSKLGAPFQAFVTLCVAKASSQSLENEVGLTAD
jgi:hypothetical protein